MEQDGRVERAFSRRRNLAWTRRSPFQSEGLDRRHILNANSVIKRVERDNKARAKRFRAQTIKEEITTLMREGKISSEEARRRLKEELGKLRHE